MESRQSADRKLVEDFLAERNERSFRALYREHTPDLYRTACPHTRYGGSIIVGRILP